MMAVFDLLEASPTFLVGLVFFFGLLVGSFLNVVIYRIPAMLEQNWKQECRVILDQITPEQLDQERQQQPAFNLLVPRSRCPHCEHLITWYENIPVVSWLALRGRCSQCRQRISYRYPIIELAAATLAALAAWKTGASIYLLFALFFVWMLLALAMIDADTTLLPDNLTLPLLWAGLLAALLEYGPVSLYDSVLGAIAGYLSLWSVYWLFKLLTGKEGMGFGDFKLYGALGAWLGWQSLPMILLLSSVVGAVIGIAMLVTGAAQRHQGIPFGPYLAGAGWIAFMWGEQLTRSYLNLL